MTNADVAAQLDEMADLLDFTGANPFRTRAYRNAARTVRDWPEPLTSILADAGRSLTEIDGVGAELAAKIAVLLAGEPVEAWEELRAQVPPVALTLLRIPGLGPKKGATLVRELNLTSLDELRTACQQQRVRSIKGFGAKTEQQILAGIDLADEAGQRIYWAEADEVVSRLIDELRGCPSLTRVEAAGSYRRRKETVGDLDLLAISPAPAEIMDRLASAPGVREVIARGETKLSLRLEGGLQVDLRVVEEANYGAALVYFTGSKDHNIVLRGRAKDRGLKINEYGVLRGDAIVAGATEAEVYAAVDLPWIPPELREARREFEWAEQGKLPRLIEVEDLQGDLHMHTTASDGHDSLAAMVEAAQRRGLRYIAITDHSKRVSVANGLDAVRLRTQWAEIDKLNRTLSDFTILKGVEVDILEPGGLDLEDDVLAEADWIVASVHFGQQQPREQITARIVEALEHPSVCAIAHPTGRLLNRRRPYEVDLERVMDVAAARGKYLELNANPARLDLDDVACAAAKARGVPIVISTDAHSIAGLQQMRYGVGQARRAGLTREDVINTRTWAEVRARLGRSS